MKFCYFILVLKAICCTESKLVFPPNSDVGYILPDEENSDQPYSSDSITTIKEHIKPPVPLTNYLTTDFNAFLARFASRKSSQSENEIPEEIKDAKHGVKMGVKNSRCDDGVHGTSIDWDGSPENYTCPSNSHSLPLDSTLTPVDVCVPIHPYTQLHLCMGNSIKYLTNIPTFGDHRPLWAVYGEYRFLPPQRWVHNVEHGAIVMLYHPCAKKELVNHLRSIVKGCLYRHLITPHNTLSPERPLALVAWGCRLEMASVDEELIKSFIRSKALKGPEGYLDLNGQFNKGLLRRASVVKGSNHKDFNLCPY